MPQPLLRDLAMPTRNSALWPMLKVPSQSAEARQFKGGARRLGRSAMANQSAMSGPEAQPGQKEFAGGVTCLGAKTEMAKMATARWPVLMVLPRIAEVSKFEGGT